MVSTNHIGARAKGSDRMRKKGEAGIGEGIKQDLLDQLERNGTVGKYYIDLVNDYMEMWDAKCRLAEDIKQRGVMPEYTSNTGQKNYKKNESVDALLKVNAQMLKLLSELGIKPAQEDGTEDDL